MGYKDSVDVKAPAVFGGEISVSYDGGDIQIIEAFKDSLADEDESMTILEAGENSGVIYESWSFENLQVERLNQAIKKDNRFDESWIDRFITFESSVITDLDSESDVVPSGVVLKQNYPNPFNPSTTVEFNLDQPGFVNLSIYDLSGRKVAELADERRYAGRYTIQFNAVDLASGVYVYRVTTGAGTLSRKLTLIK